MIEKLRYIIYFFKVFSKQKSPDYCLYSYLSISVNIYISSTNINSYSGISINIHILDTSVSTKSIR